MPYSHLELNMGRKSRNKKAKNKVVSSGTNSNGNKYYVKQNGDFHYDNIKNGKSLDKSFML